MMQNIYTMRGLIPRIQKIFLSALLLLGLVFSHSLAHAQDLQGVGHLGKVSKSISLSKHDYIPSQAIGILLPYKNDALDGRQPLVLVHGIGGTEGSKLSEWDAFLSYTDNNPAFQKAFKIYLFHYDSVQSVDKLSQVLQTELLGLIQKAPGKQIKVVGYSEGGLLVRNAMENPAVAKQTEQVITIATPFHGSPLASKSWFSSELTQQAWLDPVRVSRKIAYWVAQKKHPNFENDFHWDNVDNAMAKNFLPKEAIPVNNYALGHKTNFITYGCFFGTPESTDQQLAKSLALSIPIPAESRRVHFGKAMIFTMVNKAMGQIGRIVAKPVKLAKEKVAPSVAKVPEPQKEQIEQAADVQESHTLLSVANEELQAVSSPKADEALPYEAVSMMPFNDGISPISSSLWLGRFTPKFEKSEKDPLKRLWAALNYLKNKDQARLFPGMDHHNWVDGENRTASASLPDLLNPSDKPRSAFDWLVSDLMSHPNAQ